jgi:hypothetical protein
MISKLHNYYFARRAECLCKALWDEVRAVAFGLLEREPMRLTGDEVKATIERTRAEKPLPAAAWFARSSFFCR